MNSTQGRVRSDGICPQSEYLGAEQDDHEFKASLTYIEGLSKREDKARMRLGYKPLELQPFLRAGPTAHLTSP